MYKKKNLNALHTRKMDYYLKLTAYSYKLLEFEWMITEIFILFFYSHFSLLVILIMFNSV